jgi:hypothetical protein
MRFLSWVTAINVLVAAGFSLAGLFCPQAILPQGVTITQAASIFAMYAAARTLPLALVTLFVVWKQFPTALITLGILAGAIQLIDAAVGIYQHDAGKTVGPFVIALVQFYAVWRARRLQSPTQP